MKIELVSYDLWDTVIRRRCHPDIAKIHSANQLILMFGDSIPFHLRDPAVLVDLRRKTERDLGRSRMQNGFDDEYSIQDVLTHWVQRACRFDHSRASEIASNLIADEVAHELRTVYVDEAILETFASDQAQRRIYISDFYMPKDLVERILAAIGVLGYFDGGYVSCDIGFNKRSGRLFDRVAEIERVSTDNWHHYGDNEHSDIAIPASKGITSRHHLPESEHQRRLDAEQRFHKRENFLDGLLNSATERCSFPSVSRALPLFLGYTIFIQEQLRKHGIQHVYFFTREGEFFINLYEAMREHSHYREALPRGELLEVSRLATFVPSLSSFSITELMRIWNLYSVQSLSALFATLKFDQDAFALHAEKYGIDVYELIRYPWLDNRVQRFLADSEVQALATESIDKHRYTTLAYLNRKFESVAPGAKIAIVDIGWRGTIQDNIATMFPDHVFFGLYLGLNSFLNPQPANCIKVSFGPDLNRERLDSDLLRFVAPIEMLANSGNGSVIGYEMKGALSIPIRDVSAGENRVFEGFSRPMQMEIITRAVAIAPYLATEAITSSQLRCRALSDWRAMIFEPFSDILNAYFNLEHNETFGVGSYVTKADQMTARALLVQMLTKAGRAKARSRLSSIGWIDGYLTWRNSRLLSSLVRLLYPKK